MPRFDAAASAWALLAQKEGVTFQVDTTADAVISGLIGEYGATDKPPFLKPAWYVQRRTGVALTLAKGSTASSKVMVALVFAMNTLDGKTLGKAFLAVAPREWGSKLAVREFQHHLGRLSSVLESHGGSVADFGGPIG